MVTLSAGQRADFHRRSVFQRQSFLRQTRVLNRAKASAQANNRSIVILPGLGNSQQDYNPLAETLKKTFNVEIAKVSRPDWLRNAAGVLDSNYWKGTLQPRPVVDWYLKRIDEALALTGEQTDGGPVTLLAHSAAGWLGRIYLHGFGTQGRIDKFISLGSPHLPPLKGSKAVDQTRGILTYIENTCPGCFHQDVEYVVGRFVKGGKFGDKSSSWGQKLVGLGYQQVCGEAEVWGDGVVPEPSAHLPGALQITLEDVYHSPVGSKDGVGDKKGRLWYGSLGVLDQWVKYLDNTVDTNESRTVKAEELPQA